MYFEFGTGLSASQILAPYPQWVKILHEVLCGMEEGPINQASLIYSTTF